MRSWEVAPGRRGGWARGEGYGGREGGLGGREGDGGVVGKGEH